MNCFSFPVLRLLNCQEPQGVPNRLLRTFVAGGLMLLSAGAASHAGQIYFSLCPVGNPGNKADPITTGTQYGSVGYNYEIGTYDVTLNQYAAFLNAVANQVDTYKLYNSSMAYTGTSWSPSWNAAHGGILQTGSAGNFYYKVKGRGGDPVTFVSWLAAARFCNWIQNGQPSNHGQVPGTTETGVYALYGDTSAGVETRNPRATWWIPSENEWYKAAYYEPQLSGSGVYFLYATQNKAAPGNVVGGGTNQANYFNGLYSVTQSSTYNAVLDYLTPVGAFTSSTSYYGTYDQSGDVYNWNDAIYNTTSSTARGLRGGCWFDVAPSLTSTNRGNGSSATSTSNATGFRIGATYAAPTGVFEAMAGGAGFITVDMNAAEGFTGRLILTGTTYPLRGRMNAGVFTGVFGRSPLQVGLNLNSINTGYYTVSGTAGGQAFTAQHVAYGYARAADERGRYSILLSATDSNPTIPQNSSAATLSIGLAGGVLVGGRLPDGKIFRASGLLVLGGTGSAGNQFLICETLNYPYVTTRRAKGSVIGTLTFVPGAGTYTVQGALEWVKPGQSRGAYPAAIDTNLAVTGTFDP